MLQRRVPGLLLAVALAACGHDEPLVESGGVPVPFRLASDGATPFGDIPWPSDLYLDAGGSVGEVPGLERVAQNHASIQQGLSALDGFGRSTGALFFLDAEVDPATLPHDFAAATGIDASVFIADVDPASPARGTRYPALAKFLPTLGCISVIPLPGVVLPRGVRHAVVLTTAVRTANGEPLAPAPELSRMAGLAAAERITPAEKLYGGGLAELVGSGALDHAARVASLAVFTTSRRVEELPALRAELRQLPERELVLDPALAAPYSVAVFGIGSTPSLDDWLGKPEVDDKGIEWPGGDNPGGIAHDAIGVVVSGAFVAPSFLDGATHHFEKDASGGSVLADPEAMIPVTLVLPKKPAPPEGYPVIINGHGLSNNRGSMLSVANELARAGFAMIGIDDVLHGARAGIADEKNNYKGIYSGPDGIPDELPLAVSFFAGFSDFVAVRDNFRQTVLDQTSLVRLIQSPKLDLSGLADAAGGAAPKLDGSRIYWSGGSLGGIMGTMTVAIEPEIRGAALQVPGASFVQLITTSSAKVSPLVTTLATGTFGIQGEEVLDEHHPVANLLAAITEAGDPIAYAPHVLRDPIAGRAPPDLLVTYALGDEVLPNISTIALIRALGLDLATPDLVDIPGVPTVPAPVSGNLGPRTAAAVQYAPANHGLGYGRYDTREFLPGVPVDGDPRFPKLPKSFRIEMPVREHEAQLVTFFSTSNKGAARIEVTAPPVADFDGDGALDEKDAAPYDPDVK
jgi:dienelactone hydrolase